MNVSPEIAVCERRLFQYVSCNPHATAAERHDVRGVTSGEQREPGPHRAAATRLDGRRVRRITPRQIGRRKLHVDRELRCTVADARRGMTMTNRAGAQACHVAGPEESKAKRRRLRAAAAHRRELQRHFAGPPRRDNRVGQLVGTGSTPGVECRSHQRVSFRLRAGVKGQSSDNSKRHRWRVGGALPLSSR